MSLHRYLGNSMLQFSVWLIRYCGILWGYLYSVGFGYCAIQILWDSDIVGDLTCGFPPMLSPANAMKAPTPPPDFHCLPTCTLVQFVQFDFISNYPKLAKHFFIKGLSSKVMSYKFGSCCNVNKIFLSPYKNLRNLFVQQYDRLPFSPEENKKSH